MVPPSWEEMMEMLKGVSCFTDAEAPSTKMSDFFLLTKWVFVNMGGMDDSRDCRSGNPFCAAFSFFFSNAFSIAWYYLRLLLHCLGCGRHMLYDATREQLFKWLEVAEAMRAFISYHPGGIEEMRSRLERVEADLATAQKAVADGAEMIKLAEEEKGAIRVEADQLKGKRKP
ncbi:hypothetical protein CK203_116505 [Vitis vinifera]|uniref:Uncharacterized protein n=1 Tax=Vitis vinifera TaxID=29760 RepID=A0A438C8J2_VITVI|nr:hypothetical protein CK203_116505 [Vitis vinifera]